MAAIGSKHPRMKQSCTLIGIQGKNRLVLICGQIVFGDNCE